MITQTELQSRYKYNPNTGEFTKICYTGGRHFGKTLKPEPYKQIKINKKTYQASRLAWLYMTGENPDCFIDHINRDPADNRFSNLRKASYTENNRNRSMARNNTSGYKGVNWHKYKNKWRAEIKVNNKAITLGYFDNALDAHCAYIQASKKYHKQFGCV